MEGTAVKMMSSTGTNFMINTARSNSTRESPMLTFYLKPKVKKHGGGGGALPIDFEREKVSVDNELQRRYRKKVKK